MKFLEVKQIEGNISLINIEAIVKVSGGVVHTEGFSVFTGHAYDEIRLAIRDCTMSSRVIFKVAPKSGVWDEGFQPVT